LDSELEACGIDPSKTGIYNAAKIYNMIESHEMPNISTLFASTGVKGDNLPANYYIAGLMAPHSVNTAPLATIEAYIATEADAPKLPLEEDVIHGYFTKLADNGFDMEEVYAELLKEGLEAFEKAFQEMLDSLK
jgi:transaldolase